MRRIVRDVCRAEMRELLDPLARGEHVEIVFQCGLIQQVTYTLRVSPDADAGRLLASLDKAAIGGGS